ncbi:MAG TPA: bifunctional phosphopantothenoylcysteine decarboxylase/phosphopantothenate--cysteine ligase CoaBC [bacterium]|nr:bifunctional phosphopantothenoylcysteine decarboxylase/phosphopantothenate--cysteine ligase CoaBC [bacterium]
MERRILLGITGGIAAYKSPFLLRLFQKLGMDVKVIVTDHALEFVTRLTLESLSGNPVYHGMYEERESDFGHIELSRWTDVLVVAPATANIIAKFANGVADDLLSTTYLTLKCPVVVAPAMNDAMYSDPVTQENLEKLRRMGVHIVEPESGWLACGASGTGRMAEPETICARTELLLRDISALEGKKVLVTAGATREAIDPVRFISNRSSGKMGYAVAGAFAVYGADVTLVSGPAGLTCPANVELVRVDSASDMCEAVLSRADESDIIVKAAAVADFTPETVNDSKIKKQGDGMVLRLKRTSDILATLAERKKEGQILVGFAAETDDHVLNAAGKLKKKKLDMIVLNDVRAVDAGFAVDTNRVVLIRPYNDDAGEAGWKVKEVDGGRYGILELPLMTKLEVADKIVKVVTGIVKQDKKGGNCAE